MSFNNGFMRNRGSVSAIQATLASANAEQERGYDYDSIDAFDNVRVLHNPTSESYGITSSSEESRNVAVLYELRSDEYAILSTESSSSSVEANQPTPENLAVRSIPSNNSQRIDDWCLNNELSVLAEQQQPALTSSRVQDIIQSWGNDQQSSEGFSWRTREEYQIKGNPRENFTANILHKLNDEQYFKVRQLTKELLPLLRNSRRAHSTFTHKFKNIPSVFPQRDLILTCSLQYNESDWSRSNFLDKISSVHLDDAVSNSSGGNKSLLGWTLVPRFTDSELS